MTLTVGGRGAHLQVLLLVVVLRNAGAQGWWRRRRKEVRNRAAGRRVLPQQQQQAAAAPAEGGRAEGGGGPRGARFWAGRRFGERMASVWSGRTAGSCRPQLRRQRADVQKAAAVQGGRDFGRGADSASERRRSGAGGRLGAALSLLYTENLMGHLTSPLPAQAHKSNSPQNNSKSDRFST
ncbi:hypothetical protein PVAP13_7KG180610 [Panicum virgatum]|uniref:Uncharacterized protein n=1 Tax=Panicum virgatum TaxID=38727 RepID=A0A8T0QI39_PANVG|nr:hypothetical protein PVAP13_7KG180610 [Panicum virgatum]